MKILVSEKQEKTIIKKFMKENKKKMIENRLSDLIKKGLNTGEIKLAASALFDDVSRKKINKLDSNVELRKLLKIYSSDILNSFKLFENDIKTEMNKTIEEIITNYKNVRIENKNIINDYHNNIKKFISDNNISFIETYSDNKIVVYNINCMGKKIYDINIIYSNYRQNKYKLVFSYGDIIDKSEVNRKIKTIFIESEGSEIKETIDNYIKNSFDSSLMKNILNGCYNYTLILKEKDLYNFIESSIVNFNALFNTLKKKYNLDFLLDKNLINKYRKDITMSENFIKEDFMNKINSYGDKMVSNVSKYITDYGTKSLDYITTQYYDFTNEINKRMKEFVILKVNKIKSYLDTEKENFKYIVNDIKETLKTEKTSYGRIKTNELDDFEVWLDNLKKIAFDKKTKLLKKEGYYFIEGFENNKISIEDIKKAYYNDYDYRKLYLKLTRKK